MLCVNSDVGRFCSHVISPVLLSRATSHEERCSPVPPGAGYCRRRGRTAADGHVEGVGRNLLAPGMLALEVERGQHRGAEQDKTRSPSLAGVGAV